MPLPVIIERIPSASSENNPNTRSANSTGSWGCLIVTANDACRQAVVLAATTTSWRVVSCPDATTALKQMCLHPIKMAFVDLDQDANLRGEIARGSLRNLVEHMAWIGGILLIVNGQPDDEQMELWARQTGVWSYLPGMVPASDLTEICEQALNVVEKLNSVQQPA